MGMFDYVKCEAPLPDGWQPNGLLQTKDFDCEMVTHVITAEGRLMLEQIDETQLVPKAERPYPNEPDDSLLGMCGMMRTIRSVHDSNFHGVMRFYGSEGPGFDGAWHEYQAKFTDGRLVNIEAVEESN